MDDSIQAIALANLAFAFIPVLAVLGIFYAWSLHVGNALYAITRMLLQLLLIGYFLASIFAADNAWVVIAVLAVMVFASSWIALGTVRASRKRLYGKALLSITFGGSSTLLLVSLGVLNLQPWYLPQYLIPLAGMIFANAMNSVSLAAERFYAEIDQDLAYQQARNIAFQAALIPIINSLFAVGLVTLPGMMTGQILSGISPFIAARYQIMVMCMLFGSAGLATACFLFMLKKETVESRSNCKRA